MATVGTEDSNLLFQFNSPVNSPAMFFGGSTEAKKQPGDAALAHDSSSTLVAPGFEDQHTLFSVPTLVKPALPSSRSVLGEAKAFSHYNNYLNDRLTATPVASSPSQPLQSPAALQQQRSPASRDASRADLQLRKQKLEELVDKFWLKDGEIDESIFDDSSDEEGL